MGKAECQRQALELLERGLNEPASSPWGPPVLFLAVNDGTLGACYDCRALNSLLVTPAQGGRRDILVWWGHSVQQPGFDPGV